MLIRVSEEIYDHISDRRGVNKVKLNDDDNVNLAVDGYLFNPSRASQAFHRDFKNKNNFCYYISRSLLLRYMPLKYIASFFCRGKLL